jgi:hypothetical protein
MLRRRRANEVMTNAQLPFKPPVTWSYKTPDTSPPRSIKAGRFWGTGMISCAISQAESFCSRNKIASCRTQAHRTL